LLKFENPCCFHATVFGAAVLALLSFFTPVIGIRTAVAQESAQICERKPFEQQSYIVCSPDAAKGSLQLFWRGADGQPYRTFSQLADSLTAKGKTLVFAINAGMYQPDFTPLGLYVENGQELRPAETGTRTGEPGKIPNFYKQPNGVLYWGSAGAGILSTGDFIKQKPAAEFATQSGPMLVIDGKLNDQFIDDSSSLKWRSGVCAKTPHQVIFAVSEAPVNFHTFARLFKEELGCRDALYLDGTISQFYVDGEGYAGAPTFMVKPYAGIFAVFSQTTP